MSDICIGLKDVSLLTDWDMLLIDLFLPKRWRWAGHLFILDEMLLNLAGILQGHVCRRSVTIPRLHCIILEIMYVCHILY